MQTKLLSAFAAAALIAAPTFAFAQSNNGPMTRAEVRSQLVQLEKAGYNPSMSDNYYPENLQKAEQRAHGGNINSGGSQ